MAAVSSESFDRLMRGIAAFGLSGAGVQLDGSAVHPDTWGMLAGQVRARRIAGHLVDAIEHGGIAATPAQRLEALDLHADAMQVCLRLESMLVSATAVLDERGLEHRLLKGVAAAHLDYRDPSLRCFGDVDVLVRSSQLDEAMAVLQACGFVRRYPEPRPGFDRRFSKGVALVGPDGLELDLHRTLALGRYGLAIEEDDLWASPDLLAIGGSSHHAFGPTVRLLHACYHAALGDPRPRLTALRDIGQLLTRPDLDLRRALDVARGWGGEAVMARAVGLIEQGMGLQTGALGIWAREQQPSPADRRALRAYVDPRAGYAARAWSAVTGLSSWRDRISYVWALAAPRSEYLAGRHPSRVARLASAVRTRPRRG